VGDYGKVRSVEDLRIINASGEVTIEPDAATANYSLTLPPALGPDGSVFVSDASGALVLRQLTEDDIQPGFTIASFTKTAPDGGQTTYRRGDTLVGTAIAATYGNGPPDSATLSNSFGGSNSGSDVLPAAGTPGGWTFIAPFAAGTQTSNAQRLGTDAGADPTWTIQLSALKGAVNPTSNITITWTRDVYWGVSLNAGPLVEADIEALANSVLSGTKNRTFILAPVAEYVYYAYPDSYGAATFTVDGFPGDFQAPYNVMVTNVNGITSTYRVYRSTNLLTGTPNITFVVT
jgi:hypothetical protein